VGKKQLEELEIFEIIVNENFPKCQTLNHITKISEALYISHHFLKLQNINDKEKILKKDEGENLLIQVKR
jgi:hypothetical protein